MREILKRWQHKRIFNLRNNAPAIFTGMAIGSVMFSLFVAIGCEDAPKPGQQPSSHPFHRMQLVGVEGNEDDQWEVWYDTSTNTQILCHHSGWTGAAGGRSTSCVAVSR